MYSSVSERAQYDHKHEDADEEPRHGRVELTPVDRSVNEPAVVSPLRGVR
jgi:hypothetical protein